MFRLKKYSMAFHQDLFAEAGFVVHACGLRGPQLMEFLTFLRSGM